MNKTLLPEKEFVERFDEACKITKLKNEDIGLIMKCAKKAVSSYRRGLSPIPISRLKIFCEVFHVSADYLLGLDKKR